MSTKNSIPIVAFTSGKGGCGKTTLAVNFANIACNAGARVLLVDFDLANRGCTGLFSEREIDPNEYVTTTQLLHSEKLAALKSFEVKRGFFVVPAGVSNGENFQHIDTSLEEFIQEIRISLENLAAQSQITLIVLDCFCGVDILTTAGAGVADHTLIVNEPDIVTFSGALTLLNHLDRSFQDLEVKPKLHFIVNRLRSNFSVADLTVLYRENLERAIGEIVLCHFPYHPRIFDMFGKYPFVSDLLPRSLFVKKLELLTYLLFKGKADHLIKPEVLLWSRRKVRSVYGQSIDRTAVDPGFLVAKFTNFPLLMGIWIVFAFALFRTVPLLPTIAWAFILVLGSALAMIVATTLLHGCWLAARLNLALAEFRYRLGSKQKNVVTKFQFHIGAISPFIASVLMSISGMVLVFLLGGATCVLLDWTFNVGAIISPASSFQARQIQVAIDGPVKTVNLRKTTVSGVHFEDFKIQSPSQFLKTVVKLKFFDTSILVESPSFTNCFFCVDFLSKSDLENYVFDNCQFSDLGSRAPDTGDDNPVTRIIESNLRHVHFVRCNFPQPLTISNCTCENVEFVVANSQTSLKDVGRYIGFFQCVLNHVSLETDLGGTLVTTTDDNESHGPKPRLLTGRNVESISPADYLRRSSGARFEPNLITAELAAAPDSQQKRSLGPIPNLIEMYILSADPNYISTAKSLNAELLSRSITERQSVQEGYARMLGLILSIVSSNTKDDISAALASWCAWLQTHDKRLAWNWSKWDQYSTRLQLNEGQKILVEKLIKSVDGKLEPQRLQTDFDTMTWSVNNQTPH